MAESLRTVKGAADFLQLHVKSVYALVESKQIPHVRIGERGIRFRQEDLEAFLNERAVAAR